MTAVMTVIGVSFLATIALAVLYIREPQSALVRWHLRFCEGLSIVGAGVLALAFVAFMGFLYYALAVAAFETLFG